MDKLSDKEVRNEQDCFKTCIMLRTTRAEYYGEPSIHLLRHYTLSLLSTISHHKLELIHLSLANFLKSISGS